MGLHVFRIIPQELAQDFLLLAFRVYFVSEEVAVRHTLRSIQITLLITPIQSETRNAGKLPKHIVVTTDLNFDLPAIHLFGGTLAQVY